MSINKRQMMKISFLLFSIFFGAGNLIFPPFLGQCAGSAMVPALVGFLVTAVVLPVLGVIVIAKFGGLDKLSSRVGPRFAIFFSILIYLSLGPGLAIPRAASVPFEMAVAPYLSEAAPLTVWRLGYSLVFFAVSLWLCLTPSKLLDRFGYVLTPALLLLIFVLGVSFLARGTVAVAPPQPEYASGGLMKGFIDGYQTMDAIAGLNFGLVVSTTLMTMGITGTDSIVRHTRRVGLWVGLMLGLVYVMLAYLGMASSGVYSIEGNGAWTLRCIVEQLYGEAGAIVIASIFTLACLTTCVGLTNSISQFFNQLFPKISYRGFVYIITGFSFLVCNQGLNTILSISVPVLNAIYPASILLILMGLCDRYFEGNRLAYPLTIGLVGVVSVVYALYGIGLTPAPVTAAFAWLPGFEAGFGWVPVAVVCLAVSVVFGRKKAA
ncbi:MAG: branched-chain amino acid transport system II carrier protein [Eubacteriales bacterium]|nr:branched-chain amino acid transport system II carrier protein [Eubacteriales bacterium]